MNKKYSSILLVLNFGIIIFVFSLFSPFMKIWGYEHTIISGEDQLYIVTVSESTLFHVLSDSFYSVNERINYAVILFSEFSLILLGISSFLLLAFSLYNENKNFEKINKFYLYIEVILLMICSIFLLQIFTIKDITNHVSAVLVLTVSTVEFILCIMFNTLLGNKES